MRVKLRVYPYTFRVVLTDFRGRLHAQRGMTTYLGKDYRDRTFEVTNTVAGQAAAALIGNESVATIISILEQES